MIKDILKEGFALKQQGHYKQALEVFYKALEQDNTSSELLVEIANLYYLMKNEERALWYIQQALKTDNLHVNALKLLKTVFLSKNALSQAVQTAKNIYDITGKPSDLAEVLYLLNEQEKYKDALNYADKSNDALVLTEIAKSYYYQSDVNSAIQVLEKCLSLSPTHQEALIFLGKIYLTQNNIDKCINVIKYLPEDNKNPEIMNLLGLIAGKQENYKSAADYFIKAIKIDSQNDEYSFNLANCYYLSGNNLDAKKYYNIAISKNNSNEQYRYALAKLYYKEKRYKKALELIDDNLFDARVLKCIILCETGYLALAKQEVTALLEKQPDNETLIKCKQKIYEELGLVNNN